MEVEEGLGGFGIESCGTEGSGFWGVGFSVSGLGRALRSTAQGHGRFPFIMCLSDRQMSVNQNGSPKT